MQAKGIDYTLDDLLAADLDDAHAYIDGSFATIYLAPYNYHRVHAPFDCELRAMHYVPGDLFSVNAATVSRLPGLFRRNERLILHCVTPQGPAAVILVLSRPLEALALAPIAPEPAVAAEASRYITFRVWGAPATLSLFVLTGWFIGRGDARAPLAIVLVVNGVNIALDFLLVWGLGMRAEGVAIATVTAEYLGLVVGLVLATRTLGAVPWSRDGRGPSYRRYLSINLPLFVRTTALMLYLTVRVVESRKWR